MKKNICFIFVFTSCLLAPYTTAQEDTSSFNEEELSVAEFWQQMGPTLREKGIEAYSIRYHKDFRGWDIDGDGSISNYSDAVGYWGQFHNAGHRITCTNVIPITIDIVDDLAYARLVYEQTNTMVDGRVIKGVWRMHDVFIRYDNTWQVLESNMVKVDAEHNHYEFKCK